MPNIVFFMTDSWDGRALGCQGHPAMQRATPNADRLASEGTFFRNTYSSHPICCPQRANMWSGRYTHHCESWNNYKGIERGTPIFKDFLEAAGYRFGSELGGFGKHDYYSGAHTQLARVSAWTGPANLPLPVNYMPAEPVVRDGTDERVHKGDWRNLDKAVNFLEERAEDGETFFLYLSLGMPHPSFVTNERWLANIDLDKVTLPPEDASTHPVMEYQQRSKDWRHGFDHDLVLRTRAIYYAMCSEADGVLGELLSTLDRLDLREDTYVVFSSDHGENNMEHRQWYKMNMYESSIRVPMIVAGSGVAEGQVLDNLVSTIDLFPTFLDMAGLESPDWVDGESLLPLLTGRTRQSRNTAFAAFTGTTMNTTAWMWREGPWKYVAYPGYPPQLFKLDEDPDEINNLAEARPEIVEHMDRELRRVCDYDDAHQRCQEYNRKSFRQWRDEVKANGIRMKEYGMDVDCATYEQAMGNIYVGFAPEHEAMLERWLEG